MLALLNLEFVLAIARFLTCYSMTVILFAMSLRARCPWNRELSFVKLVTVDEYCVLPLFFFFFFRICYVRVCHVLSRAIHFQEKNYIGQMLALIAKVVFFFNVRDLLP